MNKHGRRSPDYHGSATVEQFVNHMTNVRGERVHPFVEVKHFVKKQHVKSTNREVTVEELIKSTFLCKKIRAARRQAEKAAAKLNDLEASCDHLLVHDVAGHPYDARYCCVCGKPMGLI